MTTSWRRLLQRASAVHSPNHQHRSIADARPFRPGDLVLLRPKLDRSAPPILTIPLAPGKQINSHKGLITHDSILGKHVRDVVRTAPSTRKPESAGVEFRLHEVRLEEYVRLTRRLVTPVYPADASVIVELLDLHPEASRDGEGGEKLEILEAGTGHGVMALYLSRAIHAANPPIPLKQEGEGLSSSEEESNPATEDALQHWKHHKRRAVIHSIEQNPKYSLHAQRTIQNFRHGLYTLNIDFHHTIDVSAWTLQTLAQRNNTPFLSHAFLDLPSADQNLEVVSRALRTDGCLVVFTPSITQVIDCQRQVRERGSALELERVVELGVNGGSGGREWNLRAVRLKRANVREGEVEVVRDGGSVQGVDVEGDGVTEVEDGDSDRSDDSEDVHSETTASSDSEATGSSKPEDETWSMICRPKVGDRIVGGGFLGVWRKQRRWGRDPSAAMSSQM